MTDHIYLHGSEDVQRASHTMTSAAETMLRAANLIYESVQGLERILEMDRYERAAVEEETP